MEFFEFKKLKAEREKKEKKKKAEEEKIFSKNLEELSKKIEGGNIKTNIAKESSEEVNDLKTALEHKTYQVEILKKEFTKYEEKAEEQIESLKTENSKLKYRINILLKTIEELEKNK